MKRLTATIVMMLITMAVFSQSKTLFWSLSVKVKMDKKLEYEKKVVTFLKTHYPTLKIRCWEVLTGENTGSFVFVMGPTTYKDMDIPMVSPKGEALRNTDSQALDALCESVQVTYNLRQEDLSSMKADRKLKYIAVTSIELMPGKWGDARGYLKMVKDARDKSGSKMDIDIFRPSNSGMANAYGSVRYCETMEEFSLQEDLGEMYDKAYGNNAFYKDVNDYYSLIRSTKTEVRVLRTDLSQM